MYKVLIVDDEEKARQNIANVLKLHKDFVIIGEAGNCEDAYNVILSEKPDIVFLDIKMPVADGFLLLDKLVKIGIIHELSVVFLTAYDEYALKAIKYGAMDYLLKPVDPVELKETLDRFKARKMHLTDDGLQKLYEMMNLNNKVKFTTQSGFVYLAVRDIIYVQADGSYSKIFESDSKFHHVSRNLKEIEKQLVSATFIRVHKSYLVNKEYITSYDKKSRNCTLTKNGFIINIPVSYRYVKHIS